MADKPGDPFLESSDPSEPRYEELLRAAKAGPGSREEAKFLSQRRRPRSGGVPPIRPDVALMAAALIVAIVAFAMPSLGAPIRTSIFGVALVVGVVLALRTDFDAGRWTAPIRWGIASAWTLLLIAATATIWASGFTARPYGKIVTVWFLSLPGEPVPSVFAIVGIVNPGPPTIFHDFHASAIVNGERRDASIGNVPATIYLGDARHAAALRCDSDQALLPRVIRDPIPQGGAAAGTMLISFPAMGPNPTVNLGSLQITFRDVNDVLYEAQPVPRSQINALAQVPGVCAVAAPPTPGPLR